MKPALLASWALILASTTYIAVVNADERDNHHDEHDSHPYVHHEEWKKGARMRDEDWKRGEHIDYRQKHLRAPPHGYEWREVDGNYVLGAIATGIIASIVAASVAGR